MASHHPAPTRHSRRTPVQVAALVVGVVFLLVGVAGFIPGITTQYDQMSFAGHESEALLLGIFQVSVLHNVVHLLFGVAGVALARTFNGSRGYLVGGGLIYGLLFLYGLAVGHDSHANFVPLNDADNWLHLGLAIGMVGLGLALGRRTPENATTASTTDLTGRGEPGPGRNDPGRTDLTNP